MQGEHFWLMFKCSLVLLQFDMLTIYPPEACRAMWENVLAPERDGDKQLWTRNERLTLMRCVAQSMVERRPVNWEEVARALGVSYRWTCASMLLLL